MKKAFIQLHTAVFLAGFTAILGQLIGLNEGLLVWYRLFLTVLILGAMMYFGKELVRMGVKDVFTVFGVGFIIAIHWISFYGSGKYANASVSLVCLSASGFFTALLEPLLLKRRIVWAELGLGLIAVCGIYIIFDFHPQYTTGIIFGIISSFCSALFPIFNKQLLGRFTPKSLTLYELTGGLVFTTLALPLYLSWFPAEYYLPTLGDWFWLLILATFCTVLSFNLQLNSLKKISAFTANLTYNLEPVYGIILAFVIFHEDKQFHSQFYWGILLIMLAIVLQMVRITRKPNSRAGN